jgi:lipase chaperone LimK
MIKVRVLRAQRLGRNDIQFQVRVFESADGATWFQAEGAPPQLTYPAAEVLAITEDQSLTDAEKRQAIVTQLIKPDIQALGLSDAEKALDDVKSLVSDWPVTFSL